MREIFVEKREELIRIAVKENDELVECLVEEKTIEPQIGEVYKARVKNIIPAINSIFLDIGLAKEAYMYYSEELKRTGVKKGQELLVEVLKEPLGIADDNSAIAILDYHADFEIDENENIYHLNQTAKLLNCLLDEDCKKVLAYCKVREITAALEISNVCLQLEDIIYGYFSNWVDQNIKDPDEKLGHALFDNSKLGVYMRQNKMESYFD